MHRTPAAPGAPPTPPTDPSLPQGAVSQREVLAQCLGPGLAEGSTGGGGWGIEPGTYLPLPRGRESKRFAFGLFSPRPLHFPMIFSHFSPFQSKKGSLVHLPPRTLPLLLVPAARCSTPHVFFCNLGGGQGFMETKKSCRRKREGGTPDPHPHPRFGGLGSGLPPLPILPSL